MRPEAQRWLLKKIYGDDNKPSQATRQVPSSTSKAKSKTTKKRKRARPLSSAESQASAPKAPRVSAASQHQIAVPKISSFKLTEMAGVTYSRVCGYLNDIERARLASVSRQTYLRTRHGSSDHDDKIMRLYADLYLDIGRGQLPFDYVESVPHAIVHHSVMDIVKLGRPCQPSHLLNFNLNCHLLVNKPGILALYMLIIAESAPELLVAHYISTRLFGELSPTREIREKIRQFLALDQSEKDKRLFSVFPAGYFSSNSLTPHRQLQGSQQLGHDTRDVPEWVFYQYLHQWMKDFKIVVPVTPQLILEMTETGGYLQSNSACIALMRSKDRWINCLLTSNVSTLLASLYAPTVLAHYADLQECCNVAAKGLGFQSYIQMYPWYQADRMQDKREYYPALKLYYRHTSLGLSLKYEANPQVILPNDIWLMLDLIAARFAISKIQVDSVLNLAMTKRAKEVLLAELLHKLLDIFSPLKLQQQSGIKIHDKCFVVIKNVYQLPEDILDIIIQKGIATYPNSLPKKYARAIALFLCMPPRHFKLLCQRKVWLSGFIQEPDNTMEYLQFKNPVFFMTLLEMIETSPSGSYVANRLTDTEQIVLKIVRKRSFPEWIGSHRGEFVGSQLGLDALAHVIVGVQQFKKKVEREAIASSLSTLLTEKPQVVLHATVQIANLVKSLNEQYVNINASASGALRRRKKIFAKFTATGLFELVIKYACKQTAWHQPYQALSVLGQILAFMQAPDHTDWTLNNIARAWYIYGYFGVEVFTNPKLKGFTQDTQGSSEVLRGYLRDAERPSAPAPVVSMETEAPPMGLIFFPPVPVPQPIIEERKYWGDGQAPQLMVDDEDQAQQLMVDDEEKPISELIDAIESCDSDRFQDVLSNASLVLSGDETESLFEHLDAAETSFLERYRRGSRMPFGWQAPNAHTSHPSYSAIQDMRTALTNKMLTPSALEGPKCR